ncbi:MAG: HEAT repeat domain-containing protein, partial [Candidatus Zipacnadales bacterium]
AAALALSACGTREAVPLLLDSLTDEAPEVAQAAHVALEHLTGQAQPFDGYGSLTERRRQATEWRSWFAAHHWEAVERELIERIGSEDLVEVQLAIEALGHIGGEAAKDALRNYAATETGGSLLARLAAIRALGHLRDEQAIPLLRQIIEANIGDVPAPPFKSHEFGWAAPPDHLAGAAAEALGRIGTPEAETVLVECFAKLREFWFYTFRTADHEWLMGCHSSIPHFRILEALEAMGSRRAREIVPQILRSVPMDADRGLLHVNDAYEVVTARLINRCGMGRAVIEACLAVLGEPTAQASEELMAAVSASPPAVSVGALEPTSRAAQILSIIALQPEEAARIRALFEHYRAQPSSRERSWVCFFLARALGKLRDRESIPILQATLAEEPPEAELGVPNPPNVFLFEVMTPMYRASAAHALGEIGATEAYPTLRAVVSDYRNAMDVRQAAAGALGRTAADVGQAKEIEELARSYPEVVTQQTLWEAWAQARQRIGTG